MLNFFFSLFWFCENIINLGFHVGIIEIPSENL